MSSSVRRVAMLAPIALLSSASIALATGAKKGATYSGTLAQGKQPITLKVSRNGKTVTASVLVAPFYCEGGSAGERQITKPASIAQNGSFSAAIVYEFAPTHTRTTKLYIKGKFSGKSAKGTARSEFGLITPTAAKELQKCNGSTTFSAKAK
jgi:hypothetical protein